MRWPRMGDIHARTHDDLYVVLGFDGHGTFFYMDLEYESGHPYYIRSPIKITTVKNTWETHMAESHNHFIDTIHDDDLLMLKRRFPNMIPENPELTEPRDHA